MSVDCRTTLYPRLGSYQAVSKASIDGMSPANIQGRFRMDLHVSRRKDEAACHDRAAQVSLNFQPKSDSVPYAAAPLMLDAQHQPHGPLQPLMTRHVQSTNRISQELQRAIANNAHADIHLPSHQQSSF